jgi:hypothetical protein
MVQAGQNPNQPQQNTIVPTLIIGVGGTGLEVITRIRRLVVESYDGLEKLPILSFLHIDTEEDYKVKNVNMAGPELEPDEKFWARVTTENAKSIVNDKSKSWYHEWLPPELSVEQLASEKGAGQIRTCGRFSFFHNRETIASKCLEARRRIAHLDQVTLNGNIITVEPKLNIFIVCSISGGTGSGMLIDLGYSLREWFKGENDLKLTAIVPSPDAFTGIAEAQNVQKNGYAALMELSYYADANTEFNVKYSSGETDRIKNSLAPYDFTYIIGSQNQSITIKVDAIQEIIAQNIFLDLVSSFSSYKRTIRDNVVRNLGPDQPINPENKPIGRSYPRNFLSFGIASIEIPIHQIRKHLSALLAAELYEWWSNRQVQLPTDWDVEISQELQELKLTNKQLVDEILVSIEGQRYEVVVQKWVKSLENNITTENLLQCTCQLPYIPPFAEEKGQILDFVAGYLTPTVDQYKVDHFRDDLRQKGDFIRRMDDNSQQLKTQAIKQIQEKLYNYLVDRQRGQKFLVEMLDRIESQLRSQIETLEREKTKKWQVLKDVREGDYNKALSTIEEFRLRWTATKEDFMKQECDKTLINLKQSLNAELQVKSRQLAVNILNDLLSVIPTLRNQLNRWIDRVGTSEAKYQKIALEAANQAAALEWIGLKLFEPLELKELYQDFLKVKGSKDVLFSQFTTQVVQDTNKHRLWLQSSYSTLPFQLLDVEKITNLQYPEFEKVVMNITTTTIRQAPANSKLVTDLDACTRFMRLFPTETEQKREIQLLFNRSQPLVRLSTTIPQGLFNYSKVHLAGIIGGANTTEPAAQAQVQILKGYFTQTQAIAPLADSERYKILAVQEVGGFSLRCLDGSQNLRKEYQKWRGQRIQAERARLTGQQVTLPIPVHIQKDIIFWDFMPSDPNIEKLVLVSRALGILKEEINKNTQKTVIRYIKTNDLGNEKITVATSWEDSILVLELPDCREDKEEVQRQLDSLLEAAEDNQVQKQQLRQKLESFLAERLQTVYKKTGEDNPLFLRERTIIREFLIEKKLAVGHSFSETSPTSEKPEQPNVSTESLPEAQGNNLSPKFCSECGKPVSLSAKFCMECGTPISQT